MQEDVTIRPAGTYTSDRFSALSSRSFEPASHTASAFCTFWLSLLVPQPRRLIMSSIPAGLTTASLLLCILKLIQAIYDVVEGTFELPRKRLVVHLAFCSLRTLSLLVLVVVTWYTYSHSSVHIDNRVLGSIYILTIVSFLWSGVQSLSYVPRITADGHHSFSSFYAVTPESRRRSGILQ